ncbi:hypothetical protein [Azoarcus sp. DN11]|nr:hypothetical protein [Azoarcus sp. DN11]
MTVMIRLSYTSGHYAECGEGGICLTSYVGIEARKVTAPANVVQLRSA